MIRAAGRHQKSWRCTFPPSPTRNFQVGDSLEVMTPMEIRFLSWTQRPFAVRPCRRWHYAHSFHYEGGAAAGTQTIIYPLLRQPPDRHFIIFTKKSGSQNQYIGKLSVFTSSAASYGGSTVLFWTISMPKSAAFLRYVFDPQEVDEFFLCARSYGP